jgi:hypothetical protein
MYKGKRGKKKIRKINRGGNYDKLYYMHVENAVIKSLISCNNYTLIKRIVIKNNSTKIVNRMVLAWGCFQHLNSA